MTDKENVIKRLEECLSASCRGFRTCPYSDDEWDAVRAALTLLREQEAVRPFHKCSGCNNEHALIEDSHFDYCPYCGRKVKWNATN